MTNATTKIRIADLTNVTGGADRIIGEAPLPLMHVYCPNCQNEMFFTRSKKVRLQDGTYRVASTFHCYGCGMSIVK